LNLFTQPGAFVGGRFGTDVPHSGQVPLVLPVSE